MEGERKRDDKGNRILFVSLLTLANNPINFFVLLQHIMMIVEDFDLSPTSILPSDNHR